MPADTAIWSLAKTDTALFAGTIGHIYKSSDNGSTWTDSTGIASGTIITSMVASGAAMVAGSADGIFVSTNGGSTWAASNSGLTDTRVSQLVTSGTKLFAVTLGRVFVSSTSGATWTADTSGLTRINCLLDLGTQILAGTDNDGAYVSSDGGATWTAFNAGLPVGARVWSLAATGDSVFAAGDTGIWRMPWSSTPNNPPTIATAASATPSLVTGQTTSLSVLGADDGGEENLVYTWGAVGPVPAAVTFSANSSNAAKNTNATFSKAGSYTLQATVVDALGRAAQGSVVVTVEQTATSLALSPSSASVNTLATQQFTAVARDQFGSALITQPTFTWTVSGGGVISSSGLFTAGSTAGGPFTISVSGGGLNGSASVTVTAMPSTVYQINCGGGAASPFAADQYASGGTSATYSSAITTTGVTNPAPQAVYQTERYGASTYTLPTLTVGRQYTVRLHFAELYWTATGKRKFNVAINGTTVLSSYDLYAATGARYKAIVREFTATPNSSGQIVIAFTNVTDNATISGIELIAQAPNNPPTITTAASASPNPVSATTTALSVLAADDGGENYLTYTWATTGTPPAAVTFSANGSNAAKNTTATFSKVGSYTFQVTAKDQGTLTATSSITVTVNPILTSIAVSPSSASIAPSATQTFTANARDQFATALTTQPTFIWAVSGGGSISSSGLFTAGVSAGGPYTVTASSGSVSATASITIAATPTTVYQINCGGSASSPYTADQYYSGGTAASYTSTITTTGVTNPAPQAVYKTERYGAATYTFPSLTAGAAYQVRLHFAELYWTATGKRKFNVAINSTTVLSNYDLYAATGARYKAIVREFTTTANTSGQIVIKFTNVTDNATISGIQIIRQ
jgi:hypothetical protein